MGSQVKMSIDIEELIDFVNAWRKIESQEGLSCLLTSDIKESLVHSKNVIALAEISRLLKSSLYKQPMTDNVEIKDGELCLIYSGETEQPQRPKVMLGRYDKASGHFHVDGQVTMVSRRAEVTQFSRIPELEA